jgi:ribose transport system permease protein
MNRATFGRFVRANQKTLGIFLLLVLIAGITGLFQRSFLGQGNLINMAKWIGLYGIISVGVTFVIITGGIDLSIGSLIALTGVMTPMLLRDKEMSVVATFSIITVVSLGIGLIHGLLITKMRLQPFIVTLCGLFIYRGIARSVTGDKSAAFGGGFGELKDFLVRDKLFGLVPMPFVILIVVAVIAAILLNRTVFGRHLLALGRNEDAARFSGINTDRLKIIAYMICSLLGGLAGAMFVLENNSATPSNFGNFYELYAIAGAVLGGVSLRGGEGQIAGVLCGTALMQVSATAVFFLGVDDTWKFAVIGSFILGGVTVDELLNRMGVKRRALKAAK